MCSNHHDLLEMALIESLPLRQNFSSPEQNVVRAEGLEPSWAV